MPVHYTTDQLFLEHSKELAELVKQCIAFVPVGDAEQSIDVSLGVPFISVKIMQTSMAIDTAHRHDPQRLMCLRFDDEGGYSLDMAGPHWTVTRHNWVQTNLEEKLNTLKAYTRTTLAELKSRAKTA